MSRHVTSHGINPFDHVICADLRIAFAGANVLLSLAEGAKSWTHNAGCWATLVANGLPSAAL